VSNMNDNYQEIPPLLEKLQEHQNNILHVHQLFLNNNNTSNETIKEIVSTEISVLSKLNSNPTVSNNEHKLTILGKRVESINKRQNGITQAHLDFIHSQSEFTKQYAILIGQLVNINDNGMLSPTQQLSTPVKTQLGSVSPVIVQHEPIQSEIVKPESDSTSSGKAKPQYDQDQLTSSFLEIVSNKTGYPTDILELNMDMEADLGIDSIKRVEILGTMQEEYPQLPTIPAENLVELRTLEQIIAAFGSTSKQVIETPTTTEKPMEIPQIEAAPTVSVGSLPDANLQLAFLEIVSEKTGYPPEMLELEMDMEADLGIDSIKRVEILGAMQEQFPNLPTIDAEELVELRTLKQIIERFNSDQSQQPARTTEISSYPNSNTAKSEEVQLKRREVILKTIPDPDFLKFDLKPDSLVLITDEGSDKTEKLSNYFAQQKVQIGLIHFNDPPKGVDKHSKNGFNHFYFPDADDSEVQSCMQTIIDQYKEISAFIHLNPESKGNGKGLLSTPEPNTRILKTVFLIARQLGKPLTETGENNRSAFLTITNLDGQLGINGSTSNDPIPGGFSGLTKSLRLEWPGVFCRAIDIHPEINTDTVVNIIHRELHDPDTNLAEVGYTQDGRYTLTTK